MPDVLVMARRKLKYRTRRLEAGDVFECLDRDAKVFKAAGLATDTTLTAPSSARDRAKTSERAGDTPRTVIPDELETSDIDALRAAYLAKFGTSANKHWSAAKIRREIDA